MKSWRRNIRNPRSAQQQLVRASTSALAKLYCHMPSAVKSAWIARTKDDPTWGGAQFLKQNHAAQAAAFFSLLTPAQASEKPIRAITLTSQIAGRLNIAWTAGEAAPTHTLQLRLWRKSHPLTPETIAETYLLQMGSGSNPVSAGAAYCYHSLPAGIAWRCFAYVYSPAPTLYSVSVWLDGTSV